MMNHIDWASMPEPAKAGYVPKCKHPWVMGGERVEHANWRMYSDVPLYYTVKDREAPELQIPLNVKESLINELPAPATKLIEWIPSQEQVDAKQRVRERRMAFNLKWDASPEVNGRHIPRNQKAITPHGPVDEFFWYAQVPKSSPTKRVNGFQTGYCDGVNQHVRKICQNPTKRQEITHHNVGRDDFWNGDMSYYEDSGSRYRDVAPNRVWESVRNPYDPNDKYVDGPWGEKHINGTKHVVRVPEFGLSQDGITVIPWRIKPSDKGYQLQPYNRPIDGWPRTFSFVYIHRYNPETKLGEDIDNDKVSRDPCYVDRKNGITLRPWEYQSKAKSGYMQSGGDLTPSKSGFLVPLCAVSWSGAEIQSEEVKEMRRS